LSYQATGVLHFGQRDPGEMIDSSPGMRRMQTFRKLPMMAPKTKRAKPIRQYLRRAFSHRRGGRES
jgi:hypothetical protein